MALSVPQLVSIAVGAALIDVVDYRWLGASAVLVLASTAATLLLTRAPSAADPVEPVRYTTATLPTP